MRHIGILQSLLELYYFKNPQSITPTVYLIFIEFILPSICRKVDSWSFGSRMKRTIWIKLLCRMSFSESWCSLTTSHEVSVLCAATTDAWYLTYVTKISNMLNVVINSNISVKFDNQAYFWQQSKYWSQATRVFTIILAAGYCLVNFLHTMLFKQLF